MNSIPKILSKWFYSQNSTLHGPKICKLIWTSTSSVFRSKKVLKPTGLCIRYSPHLIFSTLTVFDLSTHYLSLSTSSSSLEQSEIKRLKQELEASKRKHSNQDHPETVECLIELGFEYAEKNNNVVEAIKYYEQAYEMGKRIFKGADSPHIAATLHNLSMSYMSLQKPEEALRYCKEACDMHKRLSKGGDHPELASSLNVMGNIYKQLGNMRNSFSHYSQSYEMYTRLYPNKDNLEFSTNVENLGSFYDMMGKKEYALKYNIQALDMKKRIFPDRNHPSIASSLMDVGEIYESLKKFEEAGNYYVEAFKVADLLQDQDDPINVRILTKKGSIFLRGQPNHTPIALFHRAYEITRKICQDRPHTHTIGALKNIAIAYQFVNKPEEALKYYLEAYEMSKKVHGNKIHPEGVDSLKEIVSILNELGRKKEAGQYQKIIDDMSK